MAPERVRRRRSRWRILDGMPPRSCSCSRTTLSSGMCSCASLRAEGFGIRAVGTAHELLERVSAGPPDAFLIDIGLPGCRRAGRLPGAPLRACIDAPVLFLTATRLARGPASGFAAGGDDYVCKPFDIAEGRWPGCRRCCAEPARTGNSRRPPRFDPTARQGQLRHLQHRRDPDRVSVAGGARRAARKARGQGGADPGRVAPRCDRPRQHA